jgi:hypothetical protein
MPSPGIPGPFKAFIVIFAVLLVVAVIVGIWRAVVLRRAGLNPLIADAQLEARLAGSQALSPGRSAEDRLAELADLHERGVITDDELAAARLKVISAD